VLGQIRISPGNVVSRPILVTLKGRGAVVGQSYTDEEGHFTFNGLPGNVYHVVIEEEEYLPINEQVVVDPDTSPMRMVNIFLVPKNPAKPESSRVAGDNPYLTNEAEYGKLYPHQAVKEFKDAVKADQKHKIEEAILHYEKAVSLAPGFYLARNNLGTLYLGKSEYEAAQKQFQSVLEVHPNDPSAYFNLGNVNLLRNNLQEAERYIEQGLDKLPSSAFGHFLQGSLYSRGNTPERAESSFRRALELDPRMAQAHLALVNLFIHERRNIEAIAELKIFLKDFPGHDFAPKAREVLKKLEISNPATSAR
jgi:Tfp pilus assembly protein PilF